MFEEIGKQWVWVLDVIFGGVLTLGFQKLEEAFRISWATSVKEFLKHLLAAIAFFGFVIYDVGVYHILIGKFPYSDLVWSAPRYALDLIMAFLLLVILTRGSSHNAENYVLGILIAISLWHLGAIGWHVSANYERHKAADLVVWLPHLIFIGLYWMALLGWYVLSKIRGLAFSVNSGGFLCVLSVVVICVAIYRSVQMIHKFGIRPP